jgi:hypothetical protein
VCLSSCAAVRLPASAAERRLVYADSRTREPATGHPTFRAVFAVREFRALWAAELLSRLGDQLARVSLVVLVHHRTSSALLTGPTYALTYIPSLLGGLLLGGLADRVGAENSATLCDLGVFV